MQDDAHTQAEGSLLDATFLATTLNAAHSLLTHALRLRRSHGDLMATCTACPEVAHATETSLGVTDWRRLLRPLLRVCAVRPLGIVVQNC